MKPLKLRSAKRETTFVGSLIRTWYAHRTDFNTQCFAYAIVLPLIVFLPLVNLGGLYELGDANFPLKQLDLSYFLPWQDHVAAGSDNVFIGVPRLAYLAYQNVAISMTPTLQFAQWIFYAGFTGIGVYGALLLARHLHAGRLSPAIAVFYAFNLWSYDRIAQGPLYLAYQATPVAIYLLLQYFRAPSWRRSLAFSASLWLILGSLQIAYIDGIICASIVGYQVIKRPRNVKVTIGVLLPSVALLNAFFILPALTGIYISRQSSLSLVTDRFDLGIFAGYSKNANFNSTIRLASFFYTSFAREPQVIQVLTLLPPVVALLAANIRNSWRKVPFISGVASIVTGLWLIDAYPIIPEAYSRIRSAVPGMHFFVEPDYFMPLVLVGFLVAVSAVSRLGDRCYKRAWRICLITIACAGVTPFLPFWGALSGLPQSPIPAIYTKFASSRVADRTFWLPTDWVESFTWSPYVLNGFVAENSPSSAFGPQMLEWAPQNSVNYVAAINSAIESRNTKDAITFARIGNVGEFAIAADESAAVSHLQDYNYFINHELATGALRDELLESDGVARIDAARVTQTLPMLGLYDLPLLVQGDQQFAVAASLADEGVYRPTIVQTSSGRPFFSVFSVSLNSAHFKLMNCYDGSLPSRIIRTTKAIFINGNVAALCLNISVPIKPGVRAVTIDGRIDSLDGARRSYIAWSGSRHQSHFQNFDLTEPKTLILRPPWATKLTIFLVGEQEGTTSFSDLILNEYVRSSRAILNQHTCQASNMTWHKHDTMSYTASVIIHGQCSIILRQSFNDKWRLQIKGHGNVVNHYVVDGFANGWNLRGEGLFQIQAFYGLATAYWLGLTCSLLGLLVAIGLGIKAYMNR